MIASAHWAPGWIWWTATTRWPRERAAAIARYDGIRLVEDSLDIETCEGAATIGLELVDTAPSFHTVLIALGGALATGVGHVVKALAPEVEVICVRPLGAPAMTHSWRRRRVVTTDSTDTIADGVTGRRPIPAVLDGLLLIADDSVLVQEASIIAGMRQRPRPREGPDGAAALTRAVGRGVVTPGGDISDRRCGHLLGDRCRLRHTC